MLRSALPSDVNFMLCDFVNGDGVPVERFYIAFEEGDERTERLRKTLSGVNRDRLLNEMMAKAKRAGTETNPEDAALALNALLNEVAGRRMKLSSARAITGISINFRKAVSIAEVMPALETNFGGYALSWARGVFRHLCLGTPRLQ